jgi:hypothetical protein
MVMLLWAAAGKPMHGGAFCLPDTDLWQLERKRATQSAAASRTLFLPSQMPCPPGIPLAFPGRHMGTFSGPGVAVVRLIALRCCGAMKAGGLYPNPLRQGRLIDCAVSLQGLVQTGFATERGFALF